MEGRRIKQLRMSRGLSQERFAQLLGVSLQTVRRWEAGVTKPLPIISLKLLELEGETTSSEPRLGSIQTKRGTWNGEMGALLGFGGLLKGIGSLIDLVSEIAEDGATQAAKVGEVAALGGTLKGVYGFSVRTGLAGEPVIEQFGNIHETESGSVVTESREPIMDLLNEDDRIVIIMELPGIDENDVSVKVEGDILELAACTRDRRYQKTVRLPSAIVPDALESSYRNGILELRLAKREPSQG